MNTPQKTTEFSAHLSWAAMRRYLQEVLSPEESKGVERHLKHCPRCSAAIVGYIETEEAEHSKQYMKKLKGLLTSSQTVKKRFLSAFQIKALRTGTAVIALLIFSFFALKTVINKQDTSREFPSESLAVMKKSATTATTRLQAESKAAKPSVKATAAPAKEEPKKKAAPKSTKVERKQAVAKKVAVKKEEKKEPTKAPAPQPSVRPTATVSKAKKSPEQQTKTKAQTPKEEVALPPANQEKSAVEEPTEEEVAKVKPLPTLKKLDTQERTQSVAPLGSSRPASIPVPGNKIGER